MKTVKRKAEVGEKVFGLRSGTTYTVDEVAQLCVLCSSDDGEGRLINHSEYEVIIEDNPILAEVMDKLASQTEKGLRKYGKTVDSDDHSTIEWIDHAIEESIDHIVYLTTLKWKITNG